MRAQISTNGKSEGGSSSLMVVSESLGKHTRTLDALGWRNLEQGRLIAWPSQNATCLTPL